MKVVLLVNGKTSENYISEGVAIYAGRIKKYVPFEFHTIPDLRNNRNMPVPEQKVREGEKMGKYFEATDFVAVLDEKGKESDSVEFSEWLSRVMMFQKKRLVFVIGGPYGFSDDVLSRADARISLSKLTFSHQMVRLLFLEQLYRALSIIRGDPYHHE